ncbi:MAG: Ltp family lipoprotein [Novosphingobium sp.]
MVTDSTESGQPEKKMGCVKIGGIIAAVIFGLIVLGAIIEGDENAGSAPISASGNEAPDIADEAGDSLTGPQKNAARSAKQYLSMSGFSREGLIQQLSSDVGDGYDVADATAAVDSLSVDWNEQAARSAKSYLDLSGFSCKGLIEQLSSSAGDKYTAEQASYGAKQAGAC